jgi:hypothetical protein
MNRFRCTKGARIASVGFSSLVLFATVSILGCAAGRQIADTSFDPPVTNPAYPNDRGPVVLVDEAHNNFHTVGGRYLPFRQLLVKDGYVVRALTAPPSKQSLSGADILVISNPLAERDMKKWELPTHSAFNGNEVKTIEEWVSNGGSLFLIADHMPWPGAVSELAAAFGVLFSNGYAGEVGSDSGTLVFQVSDGSLADHPITRGRNITEHVQSVMTFGGQAFRTDVEADPLLILPRGTELLLPVTAGEFSEKTPRLPASGMLQGAVLKHGEGRVAFFGEAAMFTAQVSISGEERQLMGMNVPEAASNAQFLLNVMHWLSGLLHDVDDT